MFDVKRRRIGPMIVFLWSSPLIRSHSMTRRSRARCSQLLRLENMMWQALLPAETQPKSRPLRVENDSEESAVDRSSVDR